MALVGLNPNPKLGSFPPSLVVPSPHARANARPLSEWFCPTCAAAKAGGGEGGGGPLVLPRFKIKLSQEAAAAEATAAPMAEG